MPKFEDAGMAAAPASQWLLFLSQKFWQGQY
jgi:hypothetical protein